MHLVEYVCLSIYPSLIVSYKDPESLLFARIQYIVGQQASKKKLTFLKCSFNFSPPYHNALSRVHPSVHLSITECTQLGVYECRSVPPLGMQECTPTGSVGVQECTPLGVQECTPIWECRSVPPMGVQECTPAEAHHGGFREQGEWGQKVQGAGSMASKRQGSREQKKVIWGAGSREFCSLNAMMSHNPQDFSSPRFARLLLLIS